VVLTIAESLPCSWKLFVELLSYSCIHHTTKTKRDADRDRETERDRETDREIKRRCKQHSSGVLFLWDLILPSWNRFVMTYMDITLLSLYPSVPSAVVSFSVCQWRTLPMVGKATVPFEWRLINFLLQFKNPFILVSESIYLFSVLRWIELQRHYLSIAEGRRCHSRCFTSFRLWSTPSPTGRHSIESGSAAGIQLWAAVVIRHSKPRHVTRCTEYQHHDLLAQSWN